MKMKMAHSARLDICSHSLKCPTPAFKALQNYTTKIIASNLNLAKVIGQVAVFLVMAGILTCLLVMLHWHHNSQPNAGRWASSSRLSVSSSRLRRPLEPTSPSPPRKKTARKVSSSPQASANAAYASGNGDEENVENASSSIDTTTATVGTAATTAIVATVATVATAAKSGQKKNPYNAAVELVAAEHFSQLKETYKRNNDTTDELAYTWQLQQRASGVFSWKIHRGYGRTSRTIRGCNRSSSTNRNWATSTIIGG